eukprot:scaffold176922_cov26-Tisochrysis_lutea.AAC.1
MRHESTSGHTSILGLIVRLALGGQHLAPPQQMTYSCTAGAGERWFESIRQSLVGDSFLFRIEGSTVCASFWRVAYDIPPSTFDKLCRAVLKGERAWRPDSVARSGRLVRDE